MAYVSKEHKADVALKLKAVMPQGWKYSLAVRNFSMLVLTIWSAPVDLNAVAPNGVKVHGQSKGLVDITYLPIFEGIIAVLNEGNYNHSDTMRDFHDVGHYISIELGRWNKPFCCSITSPQGAI